MAFIGNPCWTMVISPIMKTNITRSRSHKNIQKFINKRNCSSTFSATTFPLPSSEIDRLFQGNLEVPTSNDLRVIAERQLESDIDGIIGVEAGRCKHGHPRACVRQPINSRTINSGFMRLTCPYLVQEIDKLELTAGVDGIRLLNTAVSESQNLQTSFHNINQNHKMIRNELFAHSNEYKSLIERLDAFEQGEGVGLGKGEGAQISTRVRDIGADSLLVDRVTSTSFHSVRRLVEQITGSGITGITIDKVDDVKCLHAQLADVFCRSGYVVGVTKDLTNTPAGTLSRTIGEAVLNQLQTNGVDIRGCDSCKQQCDLSTPKTSSDYWYQPAKNKLGKRKSRNRRKNQQFKSN